MTIVVPIEDAQKSLPELCERVSHGEDVLLTRAGRPVGRILPVEGVETGKRPLGLLRGRGTVSDTFNDPMPEVDEAFSCGS